MSRITRVLVLSSLAAGCGTSTPGGGALDDVDIIDVGDDTAADDASEVADVAPTDADAADAADTDVQFDPTDVVDTSDSVDTPDTIVLLPDGAECVDGAECSGGVCLDVVAGEGGGICATRCVDDTDCDENSDCVSLIGEGVDGERVCLAADLCVDPDTDGFGFGPGCAGEDCAPDDIAVNPAADEICNGYDDDCNTRIDDNPVGIGAGCQTGAPGACAAGRLECSDGITACTQLVAASEEVCNTADDDCDGEVDEGASDALTFFADIDADGFGDAATSLSACTPPDGYVDNDLDCDDTRDRVSPRGVELCNGLDDDCNAAIDDAAADATSFLVDADLDGFGVTGSTVRACALPSGASTIGGDCADDNDAVKPGATELCDEVDNDCDGEFDEGAVDRATFYVDADGDGFGNSAASVLACTPPADHVLNADDCDDATETRSPVAAERVGNQVDDDCDGTELCYADADNDGFRTETALASDDTLCDGPGEAPASAPATDCDDSTNLVNPSRDELCNEVDDDCEGSVDVGALDSSVYYVDFDGDLWGDDAAPIEACALPPGASAVPGDCADRDALVSPSEDELCDDVDNNCDDIVDTDAIDRLTFYRDADGDTFGNAASVLQVCAIVGGYVEDATDCDDSTASRSPAATEVVANQIDEDCDGGEVCYADADNDNHRVETQVRSDDALCDALGEAPASRPAGDCNDDDAAVHPGRTELCNGVDDDCADGIDTGAVDAITYYVDSDSDTWGDLSQPVRACALPVGASARSGDCNDSAPAISPSATEVCDGIDNDCTGSVDSDAVDRLTWYRDADSDTYGAASVTALACLQPIGYVASSTDCDDSTSARSPAAGEIVANQVDEDCNGGEICFVDGDNDLYRTTAQVSSADALCDASGEAPASRPAGDCNDATAAVNPGRTEVCNGVDDDCNDGADEGLLGTWYTNSDGDPYGDSSRPVYACTQPGGTTATPGDCNDANNTIYPGAGESPGDNVDSNCNGNDTCYADSDNDGVRTDTVIASPDVACDASGEAWAWETGADCNDANGTISPLAGESCNAVDDNCNGSIDDTGGACTTPIIRSFDEYHFYTTSLSEAGCCGFTVEQNPAFYLYSTQVAGTAPFYRCRSESLGRHMYTTDPGCEGYPGNEGVLGYISTSSMPGSVNLHRLYSPDQEDHLFTVSDVEIGSAQAQGYAYEGIVGQVFMSPR